jgi:diguanylate cyclase (GGDEF)-like protein
MNTLDLLDAFFWLDSATVLKIIIWGNLLFFILIAVYRSGQKTVYHRDVLGKYAVSKAVQFVGWILVMFIGRVSDIVSINIANTIVFTGLFLESRVILDISGLRGRLVYRLQLATFILIVVVFNVLQLLDYDRIGLLSVSIFVITVMFAFSGFASIFCAKRSPLRTVIGSLYLLFFVISLLRGVAGMSDLPAVSFDTGLLENVMLLVIALVLFIGGTGFLLLVKEDTDIKILEMALLDPLTGLLNRRHFSAEALGFFERHARNKKEMTVLFVDIDHFKKINDNYGHGFGDDVLKDFASHLRRNVRSTDLCCRWRGEEFIVLLSDTERDHGVVVAQRLRQEVSLSRFYKYPVFAYTASIGLHSAVPRAVAGETFQEFLEKADRAMYRAKQSGRNCVIVSD